jgi:DNA-binding GntR family transcriptional regulator
MANTKATTETSPSTTATSVYERIKEDILGGRLAPGLKLRIEFVSARYGAGSSPIREALSRLSSDGIVVRREQRGFYVASASVEELQEIVKTRCWLEAIALRESIANATPEWEDALVVAFHRLSRTERPLNEADFRLSAEWEERHAIFHDALISNCESTLLRQYCRDLRNRSDRYRKLAAASVSFHKIHEEHKAIFEATVGGKADLAADLLRSHYLTTQTVIEQRLSHADSKLPMFAAHEGVE